MTWVRALPARWRIRRTIIRVAARDFGRRPAQSALVVAGLLVSSLVISAALVAGDSIEGLFLNSTLSAFGPIDVVAGTKSSSPFSEAEALALASSPKIEALSKGSAQRLLLRGAVKDVTRDSREPEITVIGVDAVRDRSLGEFPGKVDGPSGDSMFINRRLAQRLSARVGDQLSFLVAAPSGAVAFDFKVEAILPNSGKADNGRLPNAFVALDKLQSVASMDGQVNRLVFASVKANSKSLEEAIDAFSGPIEVRGSKREDVKDSKEQTRIFRAILGMLGSIVALASVALIANLFVMLGEERRQDRGTMRALGLKRSGLVLLGISEGVFYAIAAAIAGAIVGAFFGRYLADSMGDLFTRFAGNNAFEFVRAPFEFRAKTLIFAGVGGFAISVLSVLAVTVRTSRMNIVASIKGLNEEVERKGRRFPVRQLVILMLGGGAVVAPGIIRVIGGSLIILGVSSLLSRVTSKRVGATIGGVAGLAWGLWTTTFLPDFDKNPEAGFA
ncbi:MAG: FtsX-like permease family protein, partial [Actinomycetota bacterium]